MQCQESKKILDAYVDNEVDVLQSVALEEHLAGCPDCAKTMEGRRALKSAIQNADLRYTAPPELVSAVRKELHMDEEKRVSKSWLGFNWLRFKDLTLGFAGATVAFLLAAAILGFWFHTPESVKIARATTDDYVRSMLMENRGIDVISQDTHTVKPWFTNKISFSPTVTDFADKGFPLAGGRVDFVNNQTVATLIYRRNQHYIDVFLYPSNESYEGERQERGYRILYWSKDGMQYWVVSDLNQQELEQFAALIKS